MTATTMADALGVSEPTVRRRSLLSCKKNLRKMKFVILQIACKDKRVIMSNKVLVERTQGKLVLVKSATSDDPVSTISSSVTALDVDPVEELSITQQKIKHMSTESDEFVIRKKCKNADMFQFSNQGIWGQT